MWAIAFADFTNQIKYYYSYAQLIFSLSTFLIIKYVHFLLLQYLSLVFNYFSSKIGWVSNVFSMLLTLHQISLNFSKNSFFYIERHLFVLFETIDISIYFWELHA